MTLFEYLSPVKSILQREEQQSWTLALEKKCKEGSDCFDTSSEKIKRGIWDEFSNRVRTEELKAWYSEPEGNSLFQGTSVSSLTIPYKVSRPLDIDSMEKLENQIADSYITLHKKNASLARAAIVENIDDWIREGLFYGVVLSSKVLTQALSLVAPLEEVIFKINGCSVDPHEIISYPNDIRKAYFEKCREKINCFDGLNIEQREFESSLVLADISKPNMRKYERKIMLAPVRCNEISAILAERVVEKIAEKTSGEIRPRSLAIVIYDTDTPYTYHEVMGYSAQCLSPILPGLTILGSSGTIDAFRWLYSYRLSLVAQKIQKSSLYSEVHKRFMPFVFFGVLVPRDSEILLDMDNLHRLRYLGNYSPYLEFSYLVPHLYRSVEKNYPEFSWEEFRKKHQTAD